MIVNVLFWGKKIFDMNVGKLLNRRAPLILSKPTLLFTYGKKNNKNNYNPRKGKSKSKNRTGHRKL